MLFVLPLTLVHAQDCNVLLPALQGSYKGGCKNFLAHGKGAAAGKDTYTGNFKNGYPHGHGVYTWSNGDVYEGEWDEGQRKGEGTLHYRINGVDSILSGLWEDDRYMGAKPLPPRIIQKYNVLSTSFTRTGEGNKISISFVQNGMANTIEDLVIVTSGGTESRTGKATIYFDLNFPLYCKVNYSSWNSLKTVKYSCVLEFELSQPGSWDLRIGN